MNYIDTNNEFLPSILTQDIKNYHKETISFSMLFKQFYIHLERDVLRNDHIYTIIDTCADAVIPGSSNTAFTKLKDIEQARNLSRNSRRNDALTILNKTGLTLKRNGFIHICPFLRCKSKSKIYETVIEYYTFLFPELFPQLTSRSFPNGLPDLEGLREFAVEEALKLQSVSNLDDNTPQDLQELEEVLDAPYSGYSYEELYNIGFKNSYPRSKSNRTIQQEREFAIKQSIQSTCRNAGNEIVDVLAYIHSRILEELLPIESKAVHKTTRDFYFRKGLQEGLRVEHFTSSEAYQEYNSITPPDTLLDEAAEYIDPLEELLAKNQSVTTFTEETPSTESNEFFTYLDTWTPPEKEKPTVSKDDDDYSAWIKLGSAAKDYFSPQECRKFERRYKSEKQ